MAEIIIPKSPGTINSTATYMIQGDSTGQVSVLLIHMVSNSFSGSIVVKGRKVGTSLTPQSIPYKKRWLNGAAGDDTSVVTPITTTSIIEVNAAGLDIGLDNTHTSGSMSVDFDWLIG